MPAIADREGKLPRTSDNVSGAVLYIFLRIYYCLISGKMGFILNNKLCFFSFAGAVNLHITVP